MRTSPQPRSHPLSLRCALGAVLPAATAWLLASSPVHAVERSLDTQLVHPQLLPQSLLAVDSPRVSPEGAIIGGGAWQLEHLPLEYFENAQPAGAAIATRNTLHLVAGYPLAGRVVLGGRWSASLMDGGDEPAVAPERQLAAGDLGLFAKLAMIRGERFGFGPRLDLWLPTGSDDSWVSETSVRYAPALLADLDLGLLRLVANAGMLVRPAVDTERDFALASELTLGLGAHVPVSAQWSGLVEASSRHGFDNMMRAGAENPVELKAGVRWLAPASMSVDVVAGTALNHGYGAADFRMLVAVTRYVPPPRLEREPEPVIVEAPPRRTAVVEVSEDLPDERAPVKWEKGELARVHRGQIVIRDPLQFELDTSVLLRESVTVLEAVARIMTDYPQIELLIIEGHASEEGSDRHNYELSNARAIAVYESLLSSGVRPQRLGYRGLGETVPVMPGQDEVSLARSRRVEFHIIKVRDYLDVASDYGGAPIVLPWNGETVHEPPAGSKLLSADAHPILLEEYVDEPAPAEVLPDADTFRTTYDDEEGASTAPAEVP